MRKKIKNNKGESLVETLISVLIVAFASMILTGAVATSNGIHLKIQKEDTEFSKNVMISKDGELEMLFDDTAIDTDSPLEIKIYKTANGYFYYENKKETD